jgi:hypothetical protein
MHYESKTYGGTHCPNTVEYLKDGSIIATFDDVLEVGDTVNLSAARACFTFEGRGEVWRCTELIEMRESKNVGGGIYTKAKLVLHDKGKPSNQGSTPPPPPPPPKKEITDEEQADIVDENQIEIPIADE